MWPQPRVLAATGSWKRQRADSLPGASGSAPQAAAWFHSSDAGFLRFKATELLDVCHRKQIHTPSLFCKPGMKG